MEIKKIFDVLPLQGESPSSLPYREAFNQPSKLKGESAKKGRFSLGERGDILVLR